MNCTTYFWLENFNMKIMFFNQIKILISFGKKLLLLLFCFLLVKKVDNLKKNVKTLIKLKNSSNKVAHYL